MGDAAEGFLTEIIGNRDCFVYHLDFRSGCFSYVSPAAAELFGVGLEQFRSEGLKTLQKHIDNEDMQRCLGHFRELCAACPGGRRPTRVEYRLRTAAGQCRRYLDSLTVVADADGRLAEAYGIAREIARAVDPADDESHFRAVMDAAQVGIFVVQDARFRYVNPCLASLLGMAVDELLGAMGPLDIVETAWHPVLQRHLERLGDAGCTLEVRARPRQGESFPAMLVAAPSRFCGHPAWVGTLADVSELRAAERRVRELAFFDPLTGLPNRRMLQDRLEQLLAVAERRQDRLALVFIDIDHFKRVTDSLGHSAGDELLVAVARSLEGAVRKVDTLARLGGDEFVLVLPGTAAAGAADVARRIIAQCAQPHRVAGQELAMTLSLGIAVYPDDGDDLETLLKNADAAMYQAKQSGRNGFQFYTSEMNTAALEKLLIESSLRNALARGELVLHYQPLVALDSGRIVAVEALIRWRHPEIGLIPPDRFIPVAEDSGLINPIGDWVLCEACRQLRAWLDEGVAPLQMAVNVSPSQFRQSGFVPMVAGALATSGLDPGLLELELTERTVMNDAEINLGTLSALHRMGVRLAVDDFGTGYSSLAYLKRFPVGKLKIDRSFVRDIVTDADDRAIVSTIASMGRSLRLEVLAEGVETAAQLELLREQGCDLVQGYHFSRPLPAAECAGMLRRQPFLIKG